MWEKYLEKFKKILEKCLKNDFEENEKVYEEIQPKYQITSKKI